MVPWIEGWAKARGLGIRHDAAHFLWQTIGNDLQKIGNELQKVEIFIKERKTITYDDVKAIVGDFREYTSFDLAAAIAGKNREKAFLVLHRLLQEGEQPLGLLGSIAWNFRRLVQAKVMEESGVGYDDIMKKLRVIFHQSGLFKEQMKAFSLEELRNAFPVMLSADRALKSSGLSSRLVMDRMILELCGSK
jgi:DNA polymerase-3 subunit delta